MIPAAGNIGEISAPATDTGLHRIAPRGESLRSAIEEPAMFDVLKERYFHEHYNNGFVESGITLPDTLVDEIKQHYLAKQRGHNDFPKFFVNNEHQAYLEGRVLGTVLNTFPGFGKKLVKK